MLNVEDTEEMWAREHAIISKGAANDYDDEIDDWYEENTDYRAASAKLGKNLSLTREDSYRDDIRPILDRSVSVESLVETVSKQVTDRTIELVLSKLVAVLEMVNQN